MSTSAGMSRAWSESSTRPTCPAEVQGRRDRLGARDRPRRGSKLGISNLIEIMSVATGETIADGRVGGSTAGATGPFKDAVGEAVVALLDPVQERFRGSFVPTSRELSPASWRWVPRRQARRSTPTLAPMYERMGFVRGHANGPGQSSRVPHAPGTSTSASGELAPFSPPRGHRGRVPRSVLRCSRRRVPDRGEHPLDLVLAALVDRDLDQARAR